ncbi:MAG: succinyl-diaminopimelate desuccinylase [Alphaproteobacteria bacterium]|nr:succinyl-diaminopimelate desuccinylase [Alphaproteobacteria bacterium]
MPAALTQDPVTLAQALIRVPSVTPDTGPALDLLQRVLEGAGFACSRLPFSAPGTPDVDNLYARIGTEAPHFCFAGHLDVVPVGERAAWSVDPFGGEIVNGVLYGRGANDMKSAVAAFAVAAIRVLREGPVKGSISLLITGDEEGPSINGTQKMLKALAERGERLSHCLVGEPTSVARLGDMIKIGRRGSFTGRLCVTGAQGHVAYPQRADNPIPKLIAILSRLLERKLDEGTAHFQPSNLEITSIDVGNPATNVIPASARAVFNIRHNDRHSAASLKAWIEEECQKVIAERGGAFSLKTEAGGEVFLTPPGAFTQLIADCTRALTGIAPELSTSGGTSDARFIKDYCPVAELGLPGGTMHKVDEQARVSDILMLCDIYTLILRRYFGGGV